MAGIFQNNPWSYNPYAGPQAYGQPSPFGPSFATPQIQQVLQQLQILPQQIQQLQQAIQFLPQQVAQLVAQTLAQLQTNVPSFGQPGAGLPFQSISPTVTPFTPVQPGYVM